MLLIFEIAYTLSFIYLWQLHCKVFYLFVWVEERQEGKKPRTELRFTETLSEKPSLKPLAVYVTAVAALSHMLSIK